MKKLTIKLDELRVETFATGEEPDAKGTVQGHYGTTHTLPGQTAMCTHCGQQHCY